MAASVGSAELRLRRAWISGVAASVLVLGLLPPTIANSRPGDLDRSFGGGDGKALVAINSKICRCGRGDGVEKLLRLSRGRVLAIGASNGDLAMAMFDRRGNLDPAFGGGDGKVSIHPSGLLDRSLFPVGAVRQPDGKIVVAAVDYFLARFNQDGTLDDTFGGDGIVPLFFDRGINDLALQRDGKIVVVGTQGRGGYHPVLVRFFPDGRVDESFGEKSGRFRVPSPGGTSIEALAIQTDGRIVGVGVGFNRLREQQFFIARLTRNGQMDQSFGRRTTGRAGTVETSVGAASFAWAVTIQSDGRIVAAGDDEGIADHNRFIVARYRRNGRLDRSFGGGDGVVTTPMLNAFAEDLTVRAGRILVAGGSWRKTQRRLIRGFALLSYRFNGRPDRRFGRGGVVLTEIGSNAGAESMAVQPNGRIVLGGYAQIRGRTRFALARYRSP